MVEKLHLEVEDLGEFDRVVIDVVIDFYEIDEVAVVVVGL